MWLGWRRIVVGLILIELVGWLMMRVVVSHCCIVLSARRDCTSASLRLTVLKDSSVERFGDVCTAD